MIGREHVVGAGRQTDESLTLARGEGVPMRRRRLLVALIVIVPATFVVERLISEAAKGAIVIQAQVERGVWRCQLR